MVPYPENELLPVSGLQHLAYCERQCALIHVERVWLENAFTSRGRVFHEHAHNGDREVRSTRVTTFGLPVRSLQLGLYGVADGVEFEYSDRTLSALVTACPVEYKVGKPKKGDHDVVQLAAQALCLEEMLGVTVDRAALYYGRTKHRTWIDLTGLIRARVTELSRRFHELVGAGETPPPRYVRKKCDTCSLFDICRPKTVTHRSALAYLEREITAGLQSQE
jgi:CRISPR-associated exonuclease Cas4